MTQKAKKVLVVPSNRPEMLWDFWKAWDGKGGWDYSILVEDAPQKSPDMPPFDLHVSHAEIADDLKDDAWIISKQDSACLCYGFLVAWRMGAEHALTLSDDCFPEFGHTPIFGRHLGAMSSHQRWVSTVPRMTRWPSSAPFFRVRGIPYENLGKLETVINVGLWTGVPDLDAQTQLKQPVTNFVPPPGSRLVPAGQYFPMCEMNLMVARKALPLMYFPLQGQGQPYRRFDDIWCGIIAKKACDHLGWAVSVGEPFIRHVRASDPNSNLVKEAPGVEANETFWKKVDNIVLMGANETTCMWEIGVTMERDADEYLARLGRAIGTWTRLCEAAS